MLFGMLTYVKILNNTWNHDKLREYAKVRKIWESST